MAEELMLYVPNELGLGAQKFEFTFDGTQVANSEYRIRLGHDALDARVAHKISTAKRADKGALAREVEIGGALIRRLGKDGYPPCLSRLIGYSLDPQGTLPPSAVFTCLRGTLADLTDRLPLEPRLFRQVADGLIVALCYLQAAQVVHRHIRLETVRWDPESGAVQLADFGLAAREGAVGPLADEMPWDAPEQRAAESVADCRDDVYAVGLLLARLATGQEFATDDDARDAIAHLDITQRRLLAGACAARRRDRPGADDLRRLRRLPDPLNPGMRAGRPRESEARSLFRELRKRQQPQQRQLVRDAQAVHEAARRRQAEAEAARRRQAEAERRSGPRPGGPGPGGWSAAATATAGAAQPGADPGGGPWTPDMGFFRELRARANQPRALTVAIAIASLILVVVVLIASGVL